MFNSDTKQVAEPVLYETYTVIHINQGSLVAFLNNFTKFHKIRKYNNLFNIDVV